MESYLERSKREWERASGFPADKEESYPEHTEVQEFDLIHGKSVLEYGCGGGSDTMSYLRRGNFVTAVDIVPKNVQTTKKRIKDANLPENNVNVVLLEDSVPLPFDDETFDVISSHGVLHHIKDPAPVLKEFHRVCKTGGSLYYMLYTNIMWDYFEERGMIQNFMRQYGVDKYEAFCYCTDNIGAPYARAYSSIEACALGEDNGFTIVDFNFWLHDHFVTVKCVKE